MRFFLLLLFWVSTLAAIELNVVNQPPQGLRKSPFVFTIVNGKEKYSYWHNGLGKKMIKPVKRGHLFAYGAKHNLVVLDGAKKQIIKRAVLPFAIAKISWQDDHSLGVELATKKKIRYVISLNDNTIVPGTSSSSAYLFDFNDISLHVRALGLSVKEHIPKSRAYVKKIPLEKIKSYLKEQAKFDVTNPWVDFYRGLFAYEFGSQKEAYQIWQQLLIFPYARWYQFFAIGGQVHLMNLHDVARSFHKAAMKKFIAAGFQPNMVTRLDLITHKGELSRKVRKTLFKQKWQQSSLLLEELYEFAPRCETFYGIMLAFANEMEKIGKPKLAEIWRKRATSARDFQFAWGNGVYDLLWALVLTFFFSSAFALVLYLLLAFLKSPYLSFVLKNRKEKLKYRILPTSSLLGILLCILVSVGCAIIVMAGIRSAALATSMPQGMLGHFLHPQALEWIERAPESLEKNFYRALALQVRGEYKKAREKYLKTNFAQTYNNLALIDQAQGKDPNDNFNKALALNPKLPEAVWNVRKEAISPWANVYQKYSDKPMLALATGKMHNRFLCPSLFSLNFGSLGSNNVLYNAVFWIFLIAIIVATIFSLRCLHPPQSEAKELSIQWAAVLLPGTSRYWSIFGCLISTIWISAFFLCYLNANIQVPVLSIVEVLAVVDTIPLFGVTNQVFPDIALRLQLLQGAKILIFALPVLNLLLLLLEKKFGYKV